MSEEVKMDVSSKRQQCMYGVLCKKKDTCDFFHPVVRRMRKPCMYGVLCKRKQTCKFNHPKSKRPTETQSSSSSSSHTEEKKECKFFNTDQGCKKGETCDFLHVKMNESSE